MNRSINAAAPLCSPSASAGVTQLTGVVHLMRAASAPPGFWGVVRSRFGDCVVAGANARLSWLSIDTTAAPATWVRQMHGGQLGRDDGAAQDLLRDSCAALEAGEDIYLQVRGSDFRVGVWRALLTIPAGLSLSYGELARRLGRPGAARAVGSAAAANAIACLIPCHRLIPASGGAGAYRWGTKLKSTFLALERESGKSCATLLG